jgi:hypothetical protein
MTNDPNLNPWTVFGAVAKQITSLMRKKKLDEMFLRVDPQESPLTYSIRGLGDEPDDTMLGIILTLAEFEKRLPPAKDQAA